MSQEQVLNILADMPRGAKLTVCTADGRSYSGKLELDKHNGLLVVDGDRVALALAAIVAISR